jgi:uncharacterized protein
MLPAKNPNSEVIESFYLETLKGLFFAVKGLEHPPDRFISVLRYVPDPDNGTRTKAGVRYRRFYHFAEQEQFLQSFHPQFLAFDPVFQATLQSVPKSLLRRIYDPRSRLKEMTEALTATGIEKDAAAFGTLLHEASGVPRSAIGISGSLLIGLHADSSDLDLSVFGIQNCRKVYEALRQLLDSQSVEGLRRLDVAGLKELYSQRIADTRMSYREFLALEQNKVCQGSFRGRPYFIRLIKDAREADEAYGSVRYNPLGRITITAKVADDQESIFTPCRYVLSDVRTLEGPSSTVHGIVSFRGRFCELARTGDSVRAAGTLERLEKSDGEIRHRLLLGNSPEDTLTLSN